jgi:broad specificity phosphatase PhoE
MADRIYLVRHGQTDWAALGRHTGTSDIPLNAVGESQAKSLHGVLSSVAFTRVFTSPLGRARRTAELAGYDRAEIVSFLREVDYGEDDGKTRAEIRAERPGWDFFEDGPRNGESIAAAATRAKTLLDQLHDVNGNVLLFSHGHFLRILAPVYVGTDPRFGRHLLLRPASVSVLGREHEWPNIELWDQSALA